MTPWDCYWRLKSKTPNLQDSAPLYPAVYCFVCFGAVCTVTGVLIRENVNSKIDGALSEGNFIPSFQRTGCSLNGVSFEQDRALPHTHCRFCSEEFRCSLMWLNNFTLIVLSFAIVQLWLLYSPDIIVYVNHFSWSYLKYLVTTVPLKFCRYNKVKYTQLLKIILLFWGVQRKMSLCVHAPLMQWTVDTWAYVKLQTFV
jgi:hypothetical protein